MAQNNWECFGHKVSFLNQVGDYYKSCAVKSLRLFGGSAQYLEKILNLPHWGYRHEVLFPWLKLTNVDILSPGAGKAFVNQSVPAGFTILHSVPHWFLFLRACLGFLWGGWGRTAICIPLTKEGLLLLYGGRSSCLGVQLREGYTWSRGREHLPSQPDPPSQARQSMGWQMSQPDHTHMPLISFLEKFPSVLIQSPPKELPFSHLNLISYQ